MTRTPPRSAVALVQGAPRLPPHQCSGCNNRWSGHNTAHCSACHLTFGGVQGFDTHHFKDRCRTVVEMRDFDYVVLPRNGWSAVQRRGDE